jgi:hypothetical protein
VSQAHEPPSPQAPRTIRVRAREGGTPLGVVFAAIGSLAGLAIVTLRLDRLPLVVCVFKGLTGLPCPTCGSTRAFGRLFRLDLRGALAMNPLATLGAILIALWALAELLLLLPPRRRTLAIEVAPRVATALRVAVIVAALLNWIYLLAAGR